MQIAIEQDINRPAWTSRSLNAGRVTSCPEPGAVKCRARYFDGNGVLLFCFCKINGGECKTLLGGQKHFLEDVA